MHGQVYVHRDKMPLGILKDHLEKLDFRPMLMCAGKVRLSGGEEREL